MAKRGPISSNRKKKEEIKVVEKDVASELAMKMLEKEHELERKADVKVVDELIQIYSQAIEWYSQKNDLKYLDFQSRMHKILMKPEVLQALKHSSAKSIEKPETDLIPQVSSSSNLFLSSNPVLNPIETPLNLRKNPPNPIVIPSNLQQNPPNPIENSLSSTSFDLKTDSPSSPSTPVFHPQDAPSPIPTENFMHLRRNKSEITKKTFADRAFLKKAASPEPRAKTLKIIMDRHANNNKTTASRAVADCKSQDHALERRLASRKKLQLTRSMSFTSCEQSGFLDNSFKCEISDLDEDYSTKDSCFVVEETAEEHCDKYEKMLEEIMEKNFGQRALKIAEVKHKYEVQIEEISGMGDMMQMLVSQMKKNMQEEIENIVEEFDRKRKEEIDALKAH